MFLWNYVDTVMDARNMEYIPDDCFDVIIDIGNEVDHCSISLFASNFTPNTALFDAQLCGDNNISSVQELMKEMYRVLKPGGVYIMISHGGPDTRMGYLQRGAKWAVDFVSIRKFVWKHLISTQDCF
jgi:SAM-dependent methyltransferase